MVSFSMANQCIPAASRDQVLSNLKGANHAFQELYPGDRFERQPVHTVYGGAHLFSAKIADKMRSASLAQLNTYAPNEASFSEAFDLDNQVASAVYGKVLKKLDREALEDFRIDFEDGFGNRTDDEEDAAAITAATECARGMEQETLPPFIGIRIKPFTEDLKERGIRTLDLFLGTLLDCSGGTLPDNFVVMLPKVTIPEQVAALADLFDAIETATKLPKDSLRMEMMVETTQSIMASDGTNPLRRLVIASRGRLKACHFGTYDYTASCNITARYQTMAHPACDFAHHMTRVALGQTGIFLSDGATNVMPIGPHGGSPDELTAEQFAENSAVVRASWKQAYDHIRHSLYNGFYQGWDLHPAQLPARYAAVFSFFLESHDDAANRLSQFVDKAARATLLGDTFDDAATGQGLLNFFLQAMNCGAITEEEATLASGLSVEEIQSRSFLKILRGRRS